MSNALLTSIFLVLNGDATLLAAAPGGIHLGQAPQGATYPFVEVRWQDAPRPTKVGGGGDAYRTQLVLVKGVSQTALTASQPASCGTIDARINTLLDNVTLSITGRSHMATFRDSSIFYPEQGPDATYWHQGGVYRIWDQ